MQVSDQCLFHLPLQRNSGGLDVNRRNCPRVLIVMVLQLPIIIVSDKTHLSNFSSDKSAWPVYLTIGNINKATHQQVSAWATILLGYILVIKLECFLKKC